MKKEDKNTKSRTQIINEYIHNANVFINLTQNAINKPIFENFDKAQKEYTVCLYTLYTFINDFDKKKADHKVLRDKWKESIKDFEIKNKQYEIEKLKEKLDKLEKEKDKK